MYTALEAARLTGHSQLKILSDMTRGKIATVVSEEGESLVSEEEVERIKNSPPRKKSCHWNSEDIPTKPTYSTMEAAALLGVGNSAVSYSLARGRLQTVDGYDPDWKKSRSNQGGSKIVHRISIDALIQFVEDKKSRFPNKYVDVLPDLIRRKKEIETKKLPAGKD